MACLIDAEFCPAGWVIVWLAEYGSMGIDYTVTQWWPGRWEIEHLEYQRRAKGH